MCQYYRKIDFSKFQKIENPWSPIANDLKFGILYECNIPVKHVKGISVQSTKNIKIDEKYVSILSNYRVYDDILKIELSRNSVLDEKVNFLDPNLDRLQKEAKKADPCQ